MVVHVEPLAAVGALRALRGGYATVLKVIPGKSLQLRRSRVEGYL